ncbi:cytochrome b [Sphingomonas sp.]|jgi:cytochrome b561|uniref:cytochrome b n=1 Tax=Sphingomonas sp. TaxID=28214 RepID=UPI002ED8E6A6
MATSTVIQAHGVGNDTERYGRLSQAFHWSIAALVIAAVVLGLTLDNWPRGHPTRDAVIAFHKSIGLTVLLLAFARVLWIRRSPPPPPAARLAIWERRLASVVHKLLLVMMFAMPLTGMLLSQAVGRPVALWGIGPLPQIVPFDPALPATAARPWVMAGGILHTVVFKLALFAALALHVLGVLKHAMIDRDHAMLRRMWWR